MKKMLFFLRSFVWTCVFVFVGVVSFPRAENTSPLSTTHQGLAEAKRGYPDNAGARHPALIPLSGYTTEKGKALARRYQSQLIRVIGAIGEEYPLSQMEIRAVGFLKSPQCGQRDDRYLAVIMEASEEYDPGKAAIGKRAGAIFDKYVASIAKILLKYEDVWGDKDVAGIAICPNWMLKQTEGASPTAAMSEGMFVCVSNEIGREFIHNKINLHQLATKVKVYARQGDKIFALPNMQIKEP